MFDFFSWLQDSFCTKNRYGCALVDCVNAVHRSLTKHTLQGAGSSCVASAVLILLISTVGLKIKDWKVMSVMLFRSALGKFFFKFLMKSCFSTHKSYVKTVHVACVIMSFVKGYENFGVFRMK